MTLNENNAEHLCITKNCLKEEIHIRKAQSILIKIILRNHKCNSKLYYDELEVHKSKNIYIVA